MCWVVSKDILILTKKIIFLSLFIALGAIELVTGLFYGILGYISVGVFCIVVPLLLIITIDEKSKSRIWLWRFPYRAHVFFL